MSDATPTGYALDPTDEIDTFVQEHVAALRNLFDGTEGITLDGTPNSLGSLDRVVPEALSYPPEARDDLVRALGCYVGQVCCETLGCTWDDVEGGVAVVHEDSFGNPFAWADGCLEGTTTLFDAYASFREACEGA